MKPCWCGGEARQRLDGSGLYCTESAFHEPHSTGKPDRITTLYVAGPMTGYPDCNYPAFAEAERRLADAGYTVVSPHDAHSGRNHYVDLLRTDLHLMLDCHAVALLENWWESSGARNEVQVAGLLKMPSRTIAEWLERAAYELHKGA